jgi:Na+/melibiose symporter-like transporter
MGFFSDKTRTRWGRRKPWIVIGVPLYAFVIWMLLNPGPMATAVYLGVFYIGLRATTTIFGLPYTAWGMELSANYHTRTLIQSVREKFVMIGLMTASAIVLLSEELWDDNSAGFVLSNFSWVIITLLPITALLVVMKVPEVPDFNPPKITIKESMKKMVQNKLFSRLLFIEILIAGGENFRNTLSLFFIQDYIGAGSVGRLYIIYFGVGLAAIPVWDWIARRFGKHQSLAGAMVFVSLISIGCFFLEYGQVTEFYVLFALKGFSFGAFAYLPRAMLADVVDLDTLRSGNARPASYYSILGFMTKCAVSFGGLSLPILGYIGYQTARGSVNGPDELLWLGVLYAIVPTVLFLIALYMCVTWPLNARLHAKVQRIVEKRMSRRNVTSPRNLQPGTTL